MTEVPRRGWAEEEIHDAVCGCSRTEWGFCLFGEGWYTELPFAPGVDRDQQAIYDISAGVEIPTGGTGGRQETLSDGQAVEAGQRDDRRRA
jgi:hypothetical protein